MHFITDQQDDTTIFRLREERLDSRNAGQLKAEFLILAQPDIQNLIVDLSEVRHVDSAGLSALLLAQRQMTVHEGELRLAGVTGEVLSLLEMTQLDRVFRIFNTVNEALAAPPIFRDAWERKAWEEEHANGEIVTEDEPHSGAVRAAAIAAGGSLGVAALAQIIMNTPMDDELELPSLYALGDEEDDDDDDFEDDDFDDDLEDDDDDEEAEEAEDADGKEKPEGEEVVEPDDLDEDFEDDDWDDEELDDDEEDDY